MQKHPLSFLVKGSVFFCIYFANSYVLKNMHSSCECWFYAFFRKIVVWHTYFLLPCPEIFEHGSCHFGLVLHQSIWCFHFISDFFSTWSRTCLALKVNWLKQKLHKTFYNIRVIKNCLTEKTSTQFQNLPCERKNMHPSQSNIAILSISFNKWLQHEVKVCCGLLIFFFFFFVSFVAGCKNPLLKNMRSSCDCRF